MKIFKQVPIGRMQYFLNWFLANIVLFSSKIPSMIAAIYAPENESLFNYALILGLLLGTVGYVFLFVNSILNRARDLEGRIDVSVMKWLLLAMFPLVCLYGQGLLLFKRGKK